MLLLLLLASTARVIWLSELQFYSLQGKGIFPFNFQPKVVYPKHATYPTHHIFFTYSLFYNTLNSSDYGALNYRVTDEFTIESMVKHVAVA
jgi:hypothetical protein